MASLLNETSAEVAEWSLVRYVEVSLSRYASRWRRQQRSRSGCELLLMNEPVSRDGTESAELGELLCRTPAAEEDYLTTAPLQEVLTDRRLYRAFMSLTPQQRQVLLHLVLGNMRQQALARRLNVSQQAVCKTRKQALNRLLIGIRSEGRPGPASWAGER